MKEKSARESQLVTTEIKNINVRNAVSKVNKSFFSMREKSVRESQLARKDAAHSSSSILFSGRQVSLALLSPSTSPPPPPPASSSS